MAYENFWIFISYFGDVQYWVDVTIASLVIYQLLDKKDKHKLAWIILAMLPAIIISSYVASILKGVFAIPRPCYELTGCPLGYSFPSGHATVIFAFASVVFLETRKNKKFYVFNILAVLLAVLVSLSRLFLNYHTLIDITGGAFVGIVAGYLFHSTYRSVHTSFEKKKVVP